MDVGPDTPRAIHGEHPREITERFDRLPDGLPGSGTRPHPRRGPRRTFLPAGFTVTGTTSTYRNQ